MHEPSDFLSSSQEESSLIASSSSSLVDENRKLRLAARDQNQRLHMMANKIDKDRRRHENELSRERLSQSELVDSVRGLEAKLAEQCRVNGSLNKVNKQLQAQIQSFLSQIASFAGRRVENLSDASSVVSELSNEAEENAMRLRELEERNESLSSQLEETEGVAKSKAKESANLKKALRRMKKDNENSSSNEEVANQVAQKLKKTYQKQIKELQGIIQQQKEQIENAQRASNNKGLQSNENPSNARDEIYKANIAMLNDRVLAAEQTAAESQKQYETLQGENQHLTDRGNQLFEQLEDAKDKLQIKEQTIADLKQKVRELKQNIVNLKDEVKVKNTEIAELDTTVQELQFKCTTLENEKQQLASNISKANQDGNQNSSQTAQNSERHYKDKIELYETRIASIEELYERQSQEIVELVEQRKQLLASLNQVDEILNSNDNRIQSLERENSELSSQYQQLKDETQKKNEQEEREFDQAVEDCFAFLPNDDIKERFSEMTESDSKGELLVNIVHALSDFIGELENNSEAVKESEFAEAIRKRYIVLLSHLRNAHKFLRSIANSQTISSTVNGDEISRDEFLQACARIGKFIEEQKIEFPIDEFKPSIFEPKDMNDPQKVAEVFLDLVNADDLEISPINDIFTLFMCVTQVNQILMNNIEANKAAIQQAARISQLDDDHCQQIRELRQWKDRQLDYNEALAPILRRLVGETNENPENPKFNEDDYNNLAKQVIETINPESVQTPQLQKELLGKVDDLEKMLAKLQGDIKASQNKEEKNRAQFCKKADNIVSDVTKQVEDQMAKFKEEKDRLQGQIDDLLAKNGIDKKEYEARLAKQQRKLAKRDDLINTLRSENESLTQRSIEFQNQLGQHQNRVDEGNDTIQTLKQQMQMLRDDLDKVTAHKKHYKQRYIESDAANSSTLAELKQRNEQLQQNYAKAINDLQQQLKETTEQLQKAREESQAVNSKKRDFMEQIAKLTMSKRTTELKLKAADDALARERAAAEARQKTFELALKSKSDSTIENLQGDINKCKEFIIRILHDEFGVEPPHNEDDDDDSTNELDQLLDACNDALEERKDEQFAIHDALKLRRVMQIDRKISLFNFYDRLNNEIDAEKKRADDAERFATQKSNESEKIQRESKKLERSINELNDWITWSRALLSQISDNSIPNNPPSSEVRYKIEEALYASFAQRTVRRKMDLLRTEKKLLVTQKPALLLKSVTKKGKVTSLRPMILFLIFTGRIQQLSGTLPTKFNGLTQANLPPQTIYDRRNPRPLIPYDESQ